MAEIAGPGTVASLHRQAKQGKPNHLRWYILIIVVFCAYITSCAAFKKLENLRTLLIDDDELVRDSLSMTFRAKGCRLLAVETAETGLQALQGDSIDIIICDYRLPGISGLEFFKQIKESHPDRVKILITAYGDNGISLQASEVGVHDVIKKPFSIDAIIESLGLLF